MKKSDAKNKPSPKPPTKASSERRPPRRRPSRLSLSASEGKPELETPEAPITLPGGVPRDDEPELEVRVEESLEEAEPEDESPTKQVPVDFAACSPDEISLLRAQHNF